MTNRRGFLGGLISAAGLPCLSWADAGNPAYLSAAMDPSARFALYGITARGSLAFRVPLPARGHAAAAHPLRPEAVAFARRPGAYALVLDCVTGSVLHRLEAPEGRHFYGHGSFVQDGEVLVTTENDIATGQGRLGLWSRARGYVRIGEISSGGIGPHEVITLPGSDILAVANGGICTHPQSGREKLNLPTMRPNLSFLDIETGLMTCHEVPAEMHQNSLRHIAVNTDGLVACAFQWQGDPFDAPPLMATCRMDRDLRLAEVPQPAIRALQGYAGSIAFDAEGGAIAVTSPRGGVLHLYDADGRFRQQTRRGDICGVAGALAGLLASDGSGGLHLAGADGLILLARHALAWDNHLVALPLRA